MWSNKGRETEMYKKNGKYTSVTERRSPTM